MICLTKGKNIIMSLFLSLVKIEFLSWVSFNFQHGLLVNFDLTQKTAYSFGVQRSASSTTAACYKVIVALTPVGYVCISIAGCVALALQLTVAHQLTVAG